MPVFKKRPTHEGPAFTVGCVLSGRSLEAKLVVGWFGKSWETGLVWYAFEMGKRWLSIRDLAVVIEASPAEIVARFEKEGIKVFTDLGLTPAHKRVLEEIIRRFPVEFQSRGSLPPDCLIEGIDWPPPLPPVPPPPPISAEALPFVKEVCACAGEHRGPKFGKSIMLKPSDAYATLCIYTLEEAVAQGEIPSRRAIKVGWISDHSLPLSGFRYDAFRLHVVRCSDGWKLGALPEFLDLYETFVPFADLCVMTDGGPRELIKAFQLFGARVFLPDKSESVERTLVRAVDAKRRSFSQLGASRQAAPPSDEGRDATETDSARKMGAAKPPAVKGAAGGRDGAKRRKGRDLPESIPLLEAICAHAGIHHGPSEGRKGKAAKQSKDVEAVLTILTKDQALKPPRNGSSRAIKIGKITDKHCADPWIGSLGVLLFVLETNGQWKLGTIPPMWLVCEKMTPLADLCVIIDLAPAELVREFKRSGIRKFLPRNGDALMRAFSRNTLKRLGPQATDG